MGRRAPLAKKVRARSAAESSSDVSHPARRAPAMGRLLASRDRKRSIAAMCSLWPLQRSRHSTPGSALSQEEAAARPARGAWSSLAPAEGRPMTRVPGQLPAPPAGSARSAAIRPGPPVGFAHPKTQRPAPPGARGCSPIRSAPRDGRSRWAVPAGALGAREHRAAPVRSAAVAAIRAENRPCRSSAWRGRAAPRPSRSQTGHPPPLAATP